MIRFAPQRFAIQSLVALAMAFGAICADVGGAAAAGARERSDWRAIEGSRDPSEFERFLRRYPHSVFAPRAEKRLNNLYRSEDRRRREDALGLNRAQRREVEQRLSVAGYYPGSVNGVFNRDTRQAIRDFRIDHNLRRGRFLDRPMLRELVRVTGRRIGRADRRSDVDDGRVAAGVVAGALLLGGVILLAD